MLYRRVSGKKCKIPDDEWDHCYLNKYETTYKQVNLTVFFTQETKILYDKARVTGNFHDQNYYKQ